MHLHTTTFIHILATTPAVHLPAKPGQVYTQEYAFIRLHSTPPLLHTHKVCLLLLFPEGGAVFNSEVCKILAGINFCH